MYNQTREHRIRDIRVRHAKNKTRSRGSREGYSPTHEDREVLLDEIDRLEMAYHILQAEMDVVMMEHCPEKLSEEQRARWGMTKWLLKKSSQNRKSLK